MADLDSGAWEGRFLSSGQSSGGDAIVKDMTVDSNGNFTGSYSDSTGIKNETMTGQLGFSSGTISCLSSLPGLCEDGSTYSGVMDAGKTVTAATMGATSSTDAAVFQVFTRKAASYSPADLPGTWHMNTLKSGNGGPYWERDTIKIGPTGAFSVSYTGSDGSKGGGTGQLSISPKTGALTCVSGSCSGGGSMPVMDLSKTVMIAEDSRNGASGKIQIFTKSGVPGTPTGVTAAGGNGSATISFTAPASVGGSSITGYTVTSHPAGGVDVNAGETSTTHTVDGLKNGTSYTFTVKAANSAGTGPASTASSPAIIPDGRPGAPADVKATSLGDGKVKVSFTASASNGSPIQFYTVTSKPAGGTDTNAGTASTTHTVTGLAAGTYTFSVTATNGVGTGASSNSNKVTVP
jgi:hypothetical protein